MPAPTVRRAVVRIDAVRRRLLLQLLDHIEHRHLSIDPEMFRIELSDVASLKALFTTDSDPQEISVSFTHDDLVALSTIVDAACYSIDRGDAGIPGVDASDFRELGQWVATCERWFITPLKVELLRFDLETHRRITEVLRYLENRASMIEQDIFRIDVERVHALQRLFRAIVDSRTDEAPPAAAVVTFDDVTTLAYYAMAAREYSARTSEQGLLDVTSAQLDEMLTWLALAENRLRSQPN